MISPKYLLFALSLSACGVTAASTTSTSTVEGALAAATFPAAPRSVTATGSHGATVSAAVGADGKFTLALPPGDTYRLDVVTASGTVPIVFPRASKQLDRDFAVKSGAATIQLGAVRHVASAPASGFHLLRASATDAGDDDAECTDGALADGTPCVDDDQQTTCEAAADGECEDGKDATGAACTDDDDGGADGETADDASDGGDDGDGECEDGIDASGAPCTDAPETSTQEADPNSEMAVPEHNAPQEVSGCDTGSGGDETED